MNADRMYVLLEGEIDIFLGDFVFETAGPGSLLGEMALIDDSPRTANAVAKRIKAEALVELGERQINAIARNYYLSSAQYLLRDLPPQ